MLCHLLIKKPSQHLRAAIGEVLTCSWNKVSGTKPRRVEESSQTTRSGQVTSWLTMRWMCCRAGAWGCGSPLAGCVWAGSGWGPSAGLEPGLRSLRLWTCATDSEPSSASDLPIPISPGRLGTAHNL